MSKHEIELDPKNLNWHFNFGEPMTLFDKQTLEIANTNLPYSYPYSMWIENLANREATEYDETELNVFSDVVRLEAALYQPRGRLTGQLEISVENECFDCSMGDFKIPSFVESESLSFTNCSAKGILIVERYNIFETLKNAGFCKRFNYLLVLTAGVPRATSRRLLHRLNKELKLKTYLLANNSTWGYFMFSVLKRGLLNPGDECKYYAIPEVEYLGILANDCLEFDLTKIVRHPWKDKWSARIAAMKSYRCFNSVDWLDELDRFEKQASSVDVLEFISALGKDKFFQNYLANRLET